MNLLVTGSPGVGKSLFVDALKERLAAEGYDFEAINLSQLVKDEKLYEEYDDRLDSIVMNDLKVKKRLKQLLASDQVNYILETHAVSVVPRSTIDLAFVLRVTNTTMYYDRLAARGYSPAKIEENVDCEIMQVVWMDAVERFGEESVTVLISETPEHIQDAVREAVEIIKEDN